VLGLSTMLVIGTHLRMVPRYYMQITPLIVFFVAMLLLYVVTWLGRLIARHRLILDDRRGIALLAAGPFLWLAAYHATLLPARLDAAQTYNDSGAVQRGPMLEQNQVAMDVIDKYTGPDDIVVYYRARTATLYTGRRALQTTSFKNMVANGDWFMQNKKDNYSQVVATAEQLAASDFELVWEDDNWRLWRIPDDSVELAPSSPDVQPVFDGGTVVGSPP
jgi:dolichyl-phosphate-mannose--protein O-mannosyl transferase